MPKRNRDTLKNFFRKGALPSERQFHDLIDSALNMVDEGFSKTPDNGIEVATQGEHHTLMSFSRAEEPGRFDWSLGFTRDRERNALSFSARDQEGNETPSVTLDPGGKVGVNTQAPEFALDVAGVIRSQGRIGVGPDGNSSVPADGKWHDITGPLDGCQAFEVMAGVGKKRTGKYALMHAFALNTFNPAGFLFNFLNLKKRISYHQAHYRSLGDKLKLRWSGTNREYRLQLKSNSDYGDGIRIRFYLTRLWFDSFMNDCLPDADDE